MKKIWTVLLVIALVSNICSPVVLAAEKNETDIGVDYTISEGKLELDISDIPVVNKRQLLSVSLVHKDADVKNVSSTDVLYSNSLYLNGRDGLNVVIDYANAKIMEYRLVIRDSHAGINYSGLLARKVKAYTAQQYAEYCKGSKKEAPKENGYVFSGWFFDKECTKVLTTDTVEKEAYARFVDAEVLTVRAQITTGTNANSEKTNMRFVTTADSLKYEKIGFVVEIEGREAKTVSTSTVYERLYAVGSSETVDTLLPDKEFSTISKYFCAYSFLNIPKEHFETKFTVTPYWITLDGTTVYGTKSVKQVSMGYDKEVM